MKIGRKKSWPCNPSVAWREAALGSILWDWSWAVDWLKHSKLSPLRWQRVKASLLETSLQGAWMPFTRVIDPRPQRICRVGGLSEGSLLESGATCPDYRDTLRLPGDWPLKRLQVAATRWLVLTQGPAWGPSEQEEGLCMLWDTGIEVGEEMGH